MILIEIIGWIGSILLLTAYGLNVSKRMASDSIWYYALNIAGSVCFMINTYYHRAIPSVVVNAIWAFIALAALVRKK